jgi:hypothetical protein
MNDEDMDNFVFAIYPKRTAGRMQKELQDLVCGARLFLSYLKLQKCVYLLPKFISAVFFRVSFAPNDALERNSGYQTHTVFYQKIQKF